MSVYREILKHSAIYGVGQILARLASVLLLPLYTSYLVPADYGVLQLIDLTTNVLSLLAAAGIAGAVNRFHFRELERNDGIKPDTHALWCTGVAMLLVIAGPQLAIAYAARVPLAEWMLGPIPDGAKYFSLAIATLAFGLFNNYASVYVRVQKRSVLYISVQLPLLLLQIACNVWFIAGLKLGVFGFLYSALIVAVVQFAVLSIALFARKPVRVRRDLMGPFWKYCYPLVFSSLASLVMHQADRYLLRIIREDLTEVGLYALAYQITQGVNALVLTPFHSIWQTNLYEINRMPDRIAVFGTVFRAFTFGLWLILLGIALFARPLVAIVADPSYAPAADSVPLLCLGFFFFSLHAFFSAPAFIHMKTKTIAKTATVAAIVNVGLNLALIPALGALGAAITTVFTYATFSFYGNVRYRRFEDLQFPLKPIFACVAMSIVLVPAGNAIADALGDGLGMQIVVAAGTWCVAVGCVAAGPGRGLLAPGATWVRARLTRRAETKAKAHSPEPGDADSNSGTKDTVETAHVRNSRAILPKRVSLDGGGDRRRSDHAAPVPPRT